MKKINLGKSGLLLPRIGIGCMRISGLSKSDSENLIRTAMDEGYNFFDHADIYARGLSEEKFKEAIGMNDDVREKIIIQSKCGIVPGKMYDSSKKHIIEAAEGSLRRLGTDYLDILLIHRPDALMDPDEVNEAFVYLKETGKVRHFGVSNHNSMQIEYLSKNIDVPLLTNQIQFGIGHTKIIDSGINFNTNSEYGINRTSDILDYCRLKDITIQNWSPLQYGMFQGVFLDNDKFLKLNQVMERIAKEREISKLTLAFAWILKHPAKMIPITGTTNSDRLKEILKADVIDISREEWYEIYTSAGNPLP